MIDLEMVGERHGLLHEYDLATIERLLQFGDGLNLPRDRFTTIGYTVDASVFDDILGVVRKEQEVEALAANKSGERWIAVVELAKPITHNVCQVELIESKTPIPRDKYIGVNQLHYVFSPADFRTTYSSLPGDITGALASPSWGFNMARLEAGDDTHIKIRDHTAMDLVLRTVGEVVHRRER